MGQIQMLCAAQGDWPGAIGALQEAIERGYPIPYFYQCLTAFLKETKKDFAAEKAYRQALRLMTHPAQ